MTAAVIALAIALAGAIALVGYLAYALRGALVDVRASDAARAGQLAEQQKAEQERDEALTRAALAADRATRIAQKLDVVERQRDAAFAKGIEHATDTIKLAPDGDAALRALNDLLQDVPTLPGGGAGPAGGAGDRGGGSPAV